MSSSSSSSSSSSLSHLALLLTVLLLTVSVVVVQGHDDLWHPTPLHVAMWEAGDVIPITYFDTFMNLVAPEMPVVVAMYGDDCSHSDRLLPEYKLVAKEFHGLIPFLAVNCDIYDEVCQRFGMTGVPDIRIFVDKGLHNFKIMGRTAGDIAQDVNAYLLKHLVIPIEDEDEMEGFLDFASELPHLVIFSDTDISAVWKAFSVRYKWKLVLGHIKGDIDELVEEYNVQTLPQMLRVDGGRKDVLVSYQNTYQLHQQVYAQGRNVTRPFAFDVCREYPVPRGKSNGECNAYLAKNFYASNLLTHVPESFSWDPHTATTLPRVSDHVRMSMTVDGEDIGFITLALYGDDLPFTVANFKDLCFGNPGFGFVGTGVGFISDVVSVGSPPGSRKQGQSALKVPFMDETFAVPHSSPFVLSMQNSGPHTNQGNFYLNFKEPSNDRHGTNVVFGRALNTENTAKFMQKLEDERDVDSVMSEPLHEILVTKCEAVEMTQERMAEEFDDVDGNAPASDRHDL